MDVGPLISKEAKARCERLIQSAIDQGAKCLLDGRGVKVRWCFGGAMDNMLVVFIHWGGR